MEYDFKFFLIVGFIAQLIDGTLGMGYGISVTTLLATIGIPIQSISISVHTSEVFTTFISSITHFKNKNIDKALFWKLVICGSLGGFLGAYILSSVSGNLLKPYVSIYLVVMSILIIQKGMRKLINDKDEKGTLAKNNKKINILGLIGGFFDAIGGGGWGPIVTSHIIALDYPPRYTIGTVNAAEFFVTFIQIITFSFLIGIGDCYKIIIPLIIGGMIAAPIAALCCGKIPAKYMLLLIGILLFVININEAVTGILNIMSK